MNRVALLPGFRIFGQVVTIAQFLWKPLLRDYCFPINIVRIVRMTRTCTDYGWLDPCLPLRQFKALRLEMLCLPAL